MILKPGENILYKARVHRFCYVFPLLLLMVGMLITSPPEMKADPQSQLYPVQQEIQNKVAVVKGKLPDGLWPYLVTFQAIRSNYLGLLLITVGGLRLIYAFGYRNFSRYWVTNMRVISQTSIFYDNVQEILLDRLGGVHIRYGMIGRQINRGDVLVHDKGMREIELWNLGKPKKYRNAILLAVEQFKDNNAVAAQGKKEPPKLSSS